MRLTLTRGGRQKGSSPSADNSNGSIANNPLGKRSLFDAAFKCVHPASEEKVRATFTVLLSFKCVHPAWDDDVPSLCMEPLNVSIHHDKKMVRAHFTVLASFRCVHPAWNNAMMYGPTSLCLEPLDVFIQQVKWSGAGILLWNFLEPYADVIVAAS